VTVVESKQKQPFVPQGILVGKAYFVFISVLILIYLDSDEEEDMIKSYAVC
jgi:hypothetical protein